MPAFCTPTPPPLQSHLMFLLLPYRTDAPVRRTPTVNFAIIAINCIVFAAQKMFTGDSGESITRPLMLWPLEPRAFEFVTYQFLHGDIMHLAGNMLFLWVFGNAVNARLGNFAYAMFYLACGVIAGVGFVLAGSSHPCIGASGAIAGITTAYLVFFPRADVACLYWLFIIIDVTAVRSIWLILIKIILWDNLLAMHIGSQLSAGVAYSAHIAGYLAGFLLALALLKFRAVPRDHFDLLAIWKRARQRHQYATMMADPVTRAQAQFGRVARVPASVPEPPVARPADPLAAHRESVVAALSTADNVAAVERYLDLISKDADQVLPQRFQLEIGNALMTVRRYPQAAAAYEGYLRTYPHANDLNQVKLLLGIVYARYVPQYERARSFLADCAENLSNAQQKAQALQWLGEVTRALGGAPPASAAPQ